MKRTVKLIVTGFGSGLSSKAPGTVGSIAALLTWSTLQISLPTPPILLSVILFAITTVVGGFAVHLYLSSRENKVVDPQEIVIDEWAGMFASLLLTSHTHWWAIIGALGLFRALDIIKPLYIRKLESLPGAYGVMADDILAGVWTCLLLEGVKLLAERL
jgi:phosphatidylglycerophosphatase A